MVAMGSLKEVECKIYSNKKVFSPTLVSNKCKMKEARNDNKKEKVGQATLDKVKNSDSVDDNKYRNFWYSMFNNKLKRDLNFRLDELNNTKSSRDNEGDTKGHQVSDKDFLWRQFMYLTTTCSINL